MCEETHIYHSDIFCLIMSDEDDLFGSDLELDDGADQKARAKSGDVKPDIEPADDEDLFGSEDERETEPASDQKMRDVKPFRTPSKQKMFGPSRAIEKSHDHIRIGGTGTELCTVKMPTWMDAERNEFNPERVRKEIIDCNGDASRIAHKIRWRMMQDEEGNKFRESNARVVTWSDGSVQMLVGSLVFDLVKTSLPDNLHYLYDQIDIADDQLQQCRAAFKSKLLVKPVQNLVVHVPKRQKIVHTPVQTAKKIVTTTDPEKEVEEKIRQYRLKEMRESARERAQRFVPPPDSFSADFLEYSEEEDISSEEEIPRRRIFDDDEAAQRLQAAKKGEDIKGRAIIKKKERKEKLEKVIEEPEPESEAEEDVEVHHRPAAKRRHIIEESDSD